jgi:hypothetical protein
VYQPLGGVTAEASGTAGSNSATRRRAGSRCAAATAAGAAPRRADLGVAEAEEEKDARARAVIAIGVAGRQRSAMPTAKCVSASRGETFLVGGLERPGPARLCHGGPGRKQIRSTGLSGPFPFSPSLSGL